MPIPLPTEHTYRGLSVTRTAGLKVRLLATYLARLALRHPFPGRELGALRALKGAGRGKEALVIALGPSAGALDPAKVRAMQEAGNLVVFSVNRYHKSAIAQVVPPDYLVLADPHFFAGAHGREFTEEEAGVWNYLADRPATKIVLPLGKSPRGEIATERVLRYHSNGLPGWTANVSPVRPAGYLSMTAYVALAVACWMGFDRVHVIGFDNSQYQSILLGDENELRIGAGHHVYDDKAASRALTYFQGGVAAFFEDVARLFHDLRLFSGHPVNNLAARSLVDAFPRHPDPRFLRDVPPPERTHP